MKYSFIKFLEDVGSQKSVTAYLTSRLSALFSSDMKSKEPLIKFEHIKDMEIVHVLKGKFHFIFRII